MHRSLGHKEESFACFRESVEILDKVALENPLDINLRRMAAEGFSEYGEMLVDEDRLEPAKQALAKAQEHAEAVLKDNPKHIRISSALSGVYRNRGKILGNQGQAGRSPRRTALSGRNRRAHCFRSVRAPLQPGLFVGPM